MDIKQILPEIGGILIAVGMVWNGLMLAKVARFTNKKFALLTLLTITGMICVYLGKSPGDQQMLQEFAGAMLVSWLFIAMYALIMLPLTKR